MHEQRPVGADAHAVVVERVELPCAGQQQNTVDRPVPEELLERGAADPGDVPHQRHVAEMGVVDPGRVARQERESDGMRVLLVEDHGSRTEAPREGDGEDEARHRRQTRPRAEDGDCDHPEGPGEGDGERAVAG